jgi:thiamine biosynthesis lipoprotein
MQASDQTVTLSLNATRSFRAMNTDVNLRVGDWRQAQRLAKAEALVHALEARFSRFRPDSELSRFNARSKPAFEASELMLTLLSEARRFCELTGGIFEPATLDHLEASGYDRSFEQLSRFTVTPRSAGSRSHGIAALEIDTARRSVTLPLGIRIDLGGIAKGFIVDQVAAQLTPACDYLVDAGGDIFAAGIGDDGRPWRVGVGDPFAPGRNLQIVELRDAAIATSSVVSRRWRTTSGDAHHIIDPRTGFSANNDVACTTVIAASTTAADVFAKTALILGPDEGSRFLDARAAPGLFVMSDGRLRPTRLWPGTKP